VNGRAWTADHDETMRLSYPHVPTYVMAYLLDRSEAAVNARANILGLNKSAKYLASAHACRLRRGDNVGSRYRFPKGNVPANKGLRRPGWAPGRMASTQFKKGAKPPSWLPVGSTRVNADGYLDRKVAAAGRTNLDWIAEHRLVWIAHHGEIPKGHVVTFKSGRRSTLEADITIDAIELITLAENMRRNTIHNLPAELKGAINALGGLRRSITCRSKREKQNRGSAQPPVRDARGAAGQRGSDGARSGPRDRGRRPGAGRLGQG
jgi:hypothetical protein